MTITINQENNVSDKLFIVKRKDSSDIERLIEAKSRRVVEGVVLEDYSIEAVTGHNAGELARLAAKGIKVEKAGA